MQETKTAKKIAKIVANVLLYVFIMMCVLAVVITITGKKRGDDGVTLFGKQLRIVLSPSMEECDQTNVSAYDIKDIPVKSMVFIDIVPEDRDEAQKWYADLKVGDVLTFKYVYVRQEVITHRIVHIAPNENGGYTIDLEGDNKNDADGVLTQTIDTSKTDSTNYVIGKVVGQNYLLGVIISALKTPLGLILAVILPSLIIVILEVLRIVKMLEADKRERAQTKIDDQQNELEALKRRLAELEQTRDPPDTAGPPSEDAGEDPSNNDANGTAP